MTVDNKTERSKKKFYEQKMLGFVQWVSKKFGSGMRVMVPKKCFALPSPNGFNISRQYNQFKDYCYEEGCGYWLDTQYSFFHADKEDKARDLVKPVVHYIKYLNENNLSPTLSMTFNFIKKKYASNDEEKYHAFAMINIYFYYLAFLRLYDYNIYSGRKLTGGFVRSVFGSKCCLCGEKMPQVNEENIHYSPFKGSRNYFQAHHIVPISKNGKDEIDNIILLCPSCHVKIHLGCFDMTFEELTELGKKVRKEVKDKENGVVSQAEKTLDKSQVTKENISPKTINENVNTVTNKQKEKTPVIKPVAKKNESKKAIKDINEISVVDDDYKMFLDYLKNEDMNSHEQNVFIPEDNFIDESYYEDDDDIEDIDFSGLDFSQLSGSGNKIIINRKK